MVYTHSKGCVCACVSVLSTLNQIWDLNWCYWQLPVESHTVALPNLITRGSCYRAVSDPAGSGWNLRVCISNHLPDDADATGLWPHTLNRERPKDTWDLDAKDTTKMPYGRVLPDAIFIQPWTGTWSLTSQVFSSARKNPVLFIPFLMGFH